MACWRFRESAANRVRWGGKRNSSTLSQNSESHPAQPESGSLLLARIWRKVLEHLVHAFVELFNVFLGVIGESVASRTAPDQLLGVCVEDIDHQVSDLVRLCVRGGLAQASESSPAPAAA